MWEEIHAIEVELMRWGDASDSQGGRENVQANHRLPIGYAGGEGAGALHNEGDADTALVGGGFLAAERSVLRAAVCGAPVVAEEEDKAVVLESRVPHGFGNETDRVVHGAGHGGVRAAWAFGDGRETVEV